MSVIPALRNRALPWIVVFAWLAGTAIAFWYFELRPRRSFAPQGLAAAADPRQRDIAGHWYQEMLRLSGGSSNPAPLTLVHVYREGCECNRFTEPHLAEIVARYQDKGVRFMRVEYAGAQARGMPGWVSSLPAAFVFGADNELLYFGPYSDAAWCGRSGALVEGVIDRALQGLPPMLPAPGAWGCFCEPDGKRVVELS